MGFWGKFEKKKINTALHLLAFIYFLCHIMYMFEVFELWHFKVLMFNLSLILILSYTLPLNYCSYMSNFLMLENADSLLLVKIKH